MNRRFILICCIVSAAAALFILWPNDKKKILHNMELLCKYISTEENEAGLALLASVNSASKLFATPCPVEVQSVNINQNFTRREISNHLLMMKKKLPETRFTFNDSNITFPRKNSAAITTTISLHSKTENQRFTDAYELDIEASKIEGKWLFSSFTVVEFMER